MTANRAAIYARISVDQAGLGLGVERQLQDCRAYCAEHRWSVGREYVDNDTSAYSGKQRPAYEAMLQAIKSGEIDRVVAYHTDRLHRRLRDLVEYCDVVTAAKVTTHTLKAGDIDLETPSGIMMAQIKGAVDEAYVSESRLKNIRAREQIAKNGGRHKAARVYGWNDDGMTLCRHEADIVTEIADLIIAGYSQVAIAKRLNQRGVPTIQGKVWTGIGVRKTATRLSNAGIRMHHDQQYPGNWEPIFTPEKLEEVMAAIAGRDQLGMKRGVGRVHLLTGFVYCGECGNKLGIGKGNSNGKSAYRCNPQRSNEAVAHACGRVERQTGPVEHLVSAAILERLDSDALLVAVNQAQDDKGESAALVKQRQAQQRRLDDIIEDYASGLLKRPQFAAAKATAESALEATNRKLASLTYKHTLTGIDLTKKLSETWQTATIDWKRSVIELLIDRIVINRRERHFKRVYYENWYFDPSLVDIHWKV